MSQKRRYRSLFIRIPTLSQPQPIKHKARVGKLTRWKPKILQFLLYQPHLFPTKRRSTMPIPAFLFTQLEPYDAVLTADVEPEIVSAMHDIAETLRRIRDERRCSRIQLAELTDFDLELLTTVELGFGTLELSSQVLERVEERLKRIDEARSAQHVKKKPAQHNSTGATGTSDPANKNSSQRSCV